MAGRSGTNADLAPLREALAAGKGLTPELEDLLATLDKRQYKQLKRDVAAAKAARKARREKAVMREGWRNGTWRPSLPDVRGLLEQLDASRPSRPESVPIENFAAQVLSQHGEDGMTYELLRRCGMTTRKCVELGCGHNGGNSGFLVAGLGYKGLLVDGNPEYADICRAMFDSCDVDVRSAWIDRDTVNDMLVSAGHIGEIDFLGIDLDGMDWWIWNALDVRARLVCIEFNPIFGANESVTVPYDSAFARGARDESGQMLHGKGMYGASLRALERLGTRNGYRLVGSAPRSSNAYFVRDGLANETPAVTVEDAYREPYKRNVQKLAERVRAAGGVSAWARASGSSLTHVLPDGTPEST